MKIFRYLLFVLILTMLTVLGVYVGYAIFGPAGGLVTLVVLGLINFAQYYYCDKIVILMTGAQLATKESYPNIHVMLEKLARNANIPTPRLYLVASPVPNAFATGRNPANGLVALNTGLIESLNADELEGVIAHELAHIQNYDTLISSVVATVAGMLEYFSRLYFWGSIGNRRNNRDSGWLELIIVILAPIMAVLVQLAISRSREFEADRTGAKIAGNTRGLISALKKLDLSNNRLPDDIQPNKATAHMYIASPFKTNKRSWIMHLFSTHPPMEQRIKQLEKYQSVLDGRHALDDDLI